MSVGLGIIRGAPANQGEHAAAVHRRDLDEATADLGTIRLEEGLRLGPGVLTKRASRPLDPDRAGELLLGNAFVHGPDCHQAIAVAGELRAAGVDLIVLATNVDLNRLSPVAIDEVAGEDVGVGGVGAIVVALRRHAQLLWNRPLILPDEM